MDCEGSGPPNGRGSRNGPDHAALLHETTNALTVILGWIERAKDAAETSPEVARALERAAGHAIGTRNALRRAIGAESAEQTPEQVQSLTHRTIEDLAIEARKHEVELHAQVDSACGSRSLCHPEAVWQILTNLLLNAIAVSPSGTTVHLRASPDSTGPQRTHFSVTDEGPGVSIELREQIFERGFSRRSGGAGIGLAHARRLAERLGGQLGLADAERGACFVLDWPLIPPSADSLAAAGATASATRAVNGSPRAPRNARRVLTGRNILLLEDDEAVVELLELSLTAKGATLTAVRTAEGLSDVLAQEAFDTLLIDLSPLGDDAGAVIADAKAVVPDLLVIVVSGSSPCGTSADAWIRKPFEPSELIAAIAEAHQRAE